MNRIKNLLVGVDLSDGARAALQHALRIAEQNRAVLHLMHVIDRAAVDELAAALHTSPARQRAGAVTSGRAELVRWLDPFHLPETSRTEVTVGAPVEALLGRAREVAADLVVVGAQGDNVQSPQAGSFAVQILRRSPVKVLLVDSTHTRPFRTIVACVDFTPAAREVVEQVKRLASLRASRVDFLHVYNPPWHRLRHVMPALSVSAELQEQYLRMLERQLEDFVGEMPGVQARRVLHESPAHRSGIANYAKLHDADLIVLATKTQAASDATSGASTAERLVRELPCSVLAVK